MNKPQCLNIAVIGFGHAGAVSAIELTRRGNKVTVYEQGKSPFEEKANEWEHI